MKRILKSLGKTIGYLTIVIMLFSTPVILTSLLGPEVALTIVMGLITSTLFYIIYKNEKH